MKEFLSHPFSLLNRINVHAPKQRPAWVIPVVQATLDEGRLDYRDVNIEYAELQMIEASKAGWDFAKETFSDPFFLTAEVRRWSEVDRTKVGFIATLWINLTSERDADAAKMLQSLGGLPPVVEFKYPNV